MWYEIIPTMGIIGLCYVVPQVVPYYLEQMFYKNPMRRDFYLRWTIIFSNRDHLLTGDYRNTVGLEAIPDE